MSAEHDDELFFVELPDGRTRCMSLEELDEAYQNGQIDENARVRRDGDGEWSTLAAIAGLEEPAPISVRPGQPPENGTYSREEAFAETVRENPLAAIAAGPNSLAPYAISQSDAPPSLAPTPTPGPMELDYDLEDPYAGMQKSSKGLIFGLAAAVAVAIGVTGFTLSRAHGGGEAVVQALPAAAAQALPPPAAKTEDPAPAPAPKLTDEQKKQLSALDKKHEAENAKKAKERAEKAASQQVRRTRGKSSEPFVKGTSKYDPLNGAL